MLGTAFTLMLPCGCGRVRLPPARTVAGSAGEELTWKQAVQSALTHHPDIQGARADVVSAAHGRNAALAGFLPTVNGDAALTRSRSTANTTSETWTFDVDATQPLFTGFNSTAEFLKAKRLWEASRWSYRATSAAVRLRLRTAFIGVLRLAQLLDVNRRIATRRQDNADLIQLRYDAGREHRGSLLRAQAIAEEAAYDVRQTQRRVESQRLVFGRELGGQFWVAPQLAGGMEALIPSVPETPPADYAALAEQTPAVQQQLRTAESVKADILGAQADLWPTVEGTASYGYTGEDTSSLRDRGSVGVEVSVSLFAGGAAVQELLAARQEYRAAFEAARSARDARITELSQGWAELRDARELVDVRRKFLEAARERAEIVRSQYTSGLATFQDFDIVEQELASAENAYVESLATVLTQNATWDVLRGATLEDALHGS